jgi:cell division protein FtsI/penicillin-binding protein 2
MTRRALLISLLPAAVRVNVDWLAFDLAHQAEQCTWSDARASICMGSLLKPFLALAFISTHTHFPIRYCAGARSGCWHAGGHGRQDIVAALANSCNTYFLGLANSIERAALETVALNYGLRTPDRTLTAANLIGLSAGWPQPPRSVLKAFATLAMNSRDERVRTILAGMARCADSGTARAAGFRCFAKTGTAPCSHKPAAPGDGFAVAIYPPDQPRQVILLRQHGTTGAMAARALKPLATELI